jgi:pimeloyl-ACP methyl ester carboxylesterase
VGEQQALNAGPSGIEIAYERFGDTGAPPVLLIMGAGAQMLSWPDGFCADLAGRGLQLIRFDNRDAGLSSHFPGAPVPDLQAALAGDFSTASYTLSDMAADAVGLHGADDRMCDVCGGRATAAAIPGAELVIFDGMGHCLSSSRRAACAGSDLPHPARALPTPEPLDVADTTHLA